eukprot:TRINITY_DN28967_c0_g1_i1.p1 TRINITY_DN28967_c0_g1~~TRINITY_DN28967_c0_g1_i1.p1  ORF type:complete len:901 (-),score=288.69 TRINITY_DN28967_c0_g1_i1:137-2677(-)
MTSKIFYGGVLLGPAEATATEKFLIGKDCTDPATLSGALPILGKEMVPDPSEGDVAYRTQLVSNYLYRHMLSLQGSKLSPALKSATEPYVRAVSSSKQEFQTDSGFAPVNQPIEKLEARRQATGEAVYSGDIQVPGTLYGAFVKSTNANASFTLDATPALKSPGVQACFQASDVKGSNTWQGSELLFADKTVTYYGQALALVIADTEAQAQAGAAAVKVTYSNTQPGIFTLDDAISKKSFAPNQPPPVKVGDAGSVISSAPKVFKGSAACPSQYHFYMETQTTLAIPEEDNTLKVHAATQWPSLAQQVIASVCGIDMSAVSVDVKRLGGAYGGKIDRSAIPAAAASLAAFVLKRPILVRLDIRTNMELIGKRLAYRGDYTVATDDDGILQAVKLTMYADGGYTNSGGGLDAALTAFDNVYQCPNWDVSGVLCTTNLAANTAMRGPGYVPGVFIMENVIHQVAVELGKSPEEIRAANFYQANSKKAPVTPYGMPMYWCNIDAVWNQLMTTSDFQNRLTAINKFNSENRWVKRSISAVPTKYLIGWAGANYGSHVQLLADGTVQITVAGIEMGQGLHTKVAQVAAYKLGVPIDKIKILRASTDSIPNAAPTGGSIGSGLNSLATQHACEGLMKRILPVKNLTPRNSGETDWAYWQRLVATCKASGMQLYEDYWVNPTSDFPGNYNSWGAAVAEVHVDILTGMTRVLRVDIVFDCGRSLNPNVDIGQVEGAFVMGIGYMLTENLVVDPTTGQLTSNSTWEYKPPSSKDFPVDFRVSLMSDNPNPVGVLGSKASGEPPYCMAASVFFAAKQAIAAARADAQKSGYFPLVAPATPAALSAACGVTAADYTL